MKTLLLLLSLLVVMAQPVKAQGVLSSHIQILQGDYRQQLEIYRAKKEKFTISLQQYYTLKTLASQEEAVQVTRDLFLTRADVVIKYIEVLKATLLLQDTLDVMKRDAVVAELDGITAEIKEHRRRVDIAVDRLKVDEEAAWFEEKEEAFTQGADKAGILIKIGEMQKSVNALTQVKQTIESFFQTANVSETRKVEKTRGIEELDRTITSIRDTIISAMVTYDKQIERDSLGIRASEISNILSDGYIRMLQGIEFAKELAKQ